MKERALAVLAWLAWTAVALLAFDSAYYLLSQSGLVSTPASDSGAADAVAWLKVLVAPFAGNIVIRRLAHAVLRRVRPDAGVASSP